VGTEEIKEERQRNLGKGGKCDKMGRRGRKERGRRGKMRRGKGGKV